MTSMRFAGARRATADPWGPLRRFVAASLGPAEGVTVVHTDNGAMTMTNTTQQNPPREPDKRPDPIKEPAKRPDPIREP